MAFENRISGHRTAKNKGGNQLSIATGTEGAYAKIRNPVKIKLSAFKGIDLKLPTDIICDGKVFHASPLRPGMGKGGTSDLLPQVFAAALAGAVKQGRNRRGNGLVRKRQNCVCALTMQLLTWAILRNLQDNHQDRQEVSCLHTRSDTSAANNLKINLLII